MATYILLANYTEQGIKGADSTLWVGFVTAAKTPRQSHAI